MIFTDSTYNDKEIKYWSVDVLDKTGLVKTVYTENSETAWKYGNEPWKENYEKLSSLLGIKINDICTTDQTHTNNVRVMSKENSGEGILESTREKNYDGIITDRKELLLCSFEADCVPVYFLDPVKKAIAMVHSGWRGTALAICKKTVGKFSTQFNSKSEDLIAVIGPCACKNCYEVGSELIEEFKAEFENEISKIFLPKPLDDKKYLLDLNKAIEITLLKAGVKEENIYTVNRCTIEDEKLCSYRRTGLKKTHMLTAIMLK
ncbi:MAG: peptidoglycan editing factor PgeF [Treponema sp.]|uniref:peptidoglycan editing factor PgeF n=1 Tax=Treponema sp. TaxID=166 RepID=UPI00298E6647|nr:peptidoglycan editing factor PgeF [Treponema sp.]MBR5933962.1 peptidoglycan editing factor PgeF [Treponema sp.]